MRLSRSKSSAILAVSLLASLAPSNANALWINEIFFDPPSNRDDKEEYIELRGVPGMSLDNYFLLFIENENNANNTGAAGVIDNVFDLSGKTIGSNGFMLLRQKASPYTSIAPGTSDYVNAGTLPGWGLNPTNNSIGAYNSSLILENSGFTAMLIRNDGDVVTNRPTLGFDLDQGNDGLDIATGREGWTIIDSIGVFSEPDEAVYGRTYAPITFGAAKIGDTFETIDGTVTFTEPNIEPGSTYVGLGYELEYAARWGNSTGQTAADWHVTNVTDNAGSGYTGGVDYRQAGTFNLPGDHPADDGNPNTPAPQPGVGETLESNKAVPYGTKLMNTLGAPNYITGDFNKDGFVDAADYTVWRDTKGQLGSETNHPAADPNHDFAVNDADYALWAQNFGSPNTVATPSLSVGVPEPASLLMAALAATIFVGRNQR